VDKQPSADIERSAIAVDDSPPRLTIEVADERWGLLGFVVIDRSVRGVAAGGVRFAPDVMPDELAGLARSMTYKWAFLNAPLGGAKAGICADPRRLGCDRTTIMETFGRCIAPLVRSQVYLPGIDLGTTLDDLRAIMRGAGQPLPEAQIDGGFCTGLTVFEAVRQVSRFSRQPLNGLRVAIEGFGKVASVVAELLAQAGASIVAVSTVEGAIVADSGLDLRLLLDLKRMHGDSLVRHYPGARPIALESLFTREVDVLIPGARPQVIHAGNVDHVRARAIVPIANAPLTSDAGRALAARGVVLVPDFVANCGGILASSLFSAHFDADDARWLIETTFAQTVANMLSRAQREGRSLGEVARAVAWQNQRELDQATRAAPGRFSRASRLIREREWRGVWRRMAWRAYHRWPRLKRLTRRAAIERFSEMGLGVTLKRVISSTG
jgi:glutamate dehydrogenase (NAD(P)+)